MTIQEALRAIGVTDDLLTAEEREQLDHNGYLVLEHFMSRQQLEAYRSAVDRLLAAEGENAGKEQHQEAGTDRIADLGNKDPVFDACYINPKILAAAVHVIGRDLKVFAFSTRSAIPGHGQQGLHKDGFAQPDKPGHYDLCNTIWLLDDFTTENGATRIVPGSHLIPGVPEAVADDPLAPHPEEIQLLAPAGSVVIFNSHMLHGGTRNLTDRPRRAMFVSYSRRDIPQLTDQRQYLRPDTRDRLSEAAKVLLDVASGSPRPDGTG